MRLLERHPRIVLALLLVIASSLFASTAWMADDAYITLRTVRNLLEGHGPVYNVGERVQAYTHPLWFLLLAATSAVTREMYLTPLLLSAVLSLATLGLFFSAARRAGASIGWALTGAGLLLASRSFVDYSSSGLENALSHLLALGFFVILAEVLGEDGSEPARPGALRRHLLLGACAGLLVLNRVDMGLLVGPGLLASLWRLRHDRGAQRRAAAGIAAGFVPFALWEILSIVYYGALVPNTAVAKLQSGIPSSALMRQGLRYFANSLQVDPLTLTVVVATLLIAVRRRRLWDLALALGVVLYLAYIVRIGGDFMSGRFFSAVLVVSALLIVRSMPALADRRLSIPLGVPGRARSGVPGRLPVLPAGLGVLALVLIGLTPRPPGFFTSGLGADKAGTLDASGISDERRFYYQQTGLLNGQPLAMKPGSRGYTLAGQAARRAQAPVLPEEMIGVRGIQADAGVHIVDQRGLAEPLLARLPCVRHDITYETFRRGLGLPPSQEGWRIGHFLRNIPPGYLATLLTKEERIEDPEIAALYRQVRVITSGPLFATARWSAIASQLLARRAAPATRPEYAPVDYTELLSNAPDVPEYFFRRAQERYARGDFGAAEKDAERATELDALYTPALAQLAQIRAQTGDLPRAIDLLERARSAEPRDGQIRIDLGDLYLQAGNAAQAVHLYQEALTLDPAQPAKFYNSLGVAQALARDEAAAGASFERALQLAPKQPEAYDNLAQLELARGETAKACALYEQVLALQPDRSILLNAGIAFGEAGRTREAVALLERAWSDGSQDASVAYHLAHALATAGEHGRALEMLRIAARLGHQTAQQELTALEPGD